MPVPTNYPHADLPAPKVGKQREALPNNDVRTKFDGKSLQRKVRDFSTTYIDVTFEVPINKVMLFRLWLSKVDQGQSFDIDLKSEGGTITQTCTWHLPPITPRENNSFYTYTGTLYCEQFNDGVTNLTEAEQDFLYDVTAANGIPSIAIAVNENWPN